MTEIPVTATEVHERELEHVKDINAELVDALKGMVEDFNNTYGGHPSEQPSVVIAARAVLAKVNGAAE